jgi:signal transduction histidine kinase
LISWFVGLTTALLAAFSAALYFSTSRALRSGLDARLETATTGLVALCEWDEDTWGVQIDLSDELAKQLAVSFPERSQEIWTWPDKRPLHRSGRLLDLPLPDASWGEGAGPGHAAATAYVTADSAAGRRRVLTVLARSPATPADAFEGEPATPAFTVLVRVAEDLAPIEAELAYLTWFMAGFASISVLVTVFFGFLLSRRVVRPLKELGEAAAGIHAGGTVELPRRAEGDEVDRLRSLLEDAFLRLEDALKRQARFTADAAHELRNPITVIRNAAEVALRRARPPEDYRMFLDDVLATSKRMGSVVEVLLFLARMDAGTLATSFKKVDLAAIARDSAAAQPQTNGRVHIEANGGAFVEGDEVLLSVLVDNLLSNALRYSGTESRVTVTVEADDGVLLRVQDEGPGIPQESLPHVFDRFFRVASANPDARGAGLGLAIVAEILSVHSATSHIDTSEAGTTVSVKFPAR